jgi:hypothetical protein
MFRTSNSNRIGKAFSPAEIAAVWQKGVVVANYNPDFVRADACGSLLEYRRYGDTSSLYGWEIDHIIPVSKNGSDNITNLQPLQWERNRKKADQIGINYCLL